MPKSASKKKQASATKDQDALIDFVIITALDIERQAVCRAFNLTDDDRVDTGARRYWRGKLDLKNNKSYEIVVAQLADMASLDAVYQTQEAIRDWDPGALLLVGIAGAATPEANLGDLVVGSEIYYYERGKETPGGKLPEPKMFKADPILLNKVISTSQWKSRILAKRPDGEKKKRPEILRGLIASGEKVIANEAIRDEIAQSHRKILAIEMEGYGFSMAVFNSVDQRRHLVIKAICDKADRNKSENWQLYAAAVAASYTKHFLLDQPLEPRNSPKEEPPQKLIDEKRQNIEKQGQDLLNKASPTLEALDNELSSPIASRDGSPSVGKFEVQTGDPASSANYLAAIPSQIGDLFATLTNAVSQEILAQLERIRELYREGKVKRAAEEIQSVREGSSWPFLNSVAKVKLLRIMAVNKLNSEHPNLDEAHELEREIEAYDSSSKDLQVVRAFIAFYEQGPDVAIDKLGDVFDTDSLNYKIFFLINSNQVEDAFKLVTNVPPEVALDVETKRLQALMLLIKGDSDRAQTLIKEILNERPNWDLSQWVAGMIYYTAALSPALKFNPYVSWPQPIDWPFVKGDSKSRILLETAEEIFARLATETERGEEHQKIFEIWRLACLANNWQRQDIALSYCESLLEKDPANHRALAWVMARRYKVNISSCVNALKKAIEQEDTLNPVMKAEKTLALAGIYLETGKILEALELLERGREDFIKIGNESLWYFWKAQVFIANDNPEKALELINDN